MSEKSASVIKEGSILLKSGKNLLHKVIWKTRVFKLSNNGVLLVVKIGSTSPLFTFPLQDCAVQQESGEFAFSIKHKDNTSVFAASNSQEYCDWLHVIKESQGEKPQKEASSASAPVNPAVGALKKPRRNSLLQSAKKNVAGKIVSSKVGKDILKKVLDEDVSNAVQTCNSLISEQLGPERAHEFENDMIKLLVKGHMAFENKIIQTEQFAPAEFLVKKVFYLLTGAFRMDIETQTTQMKEVLSRAARFIVAIQELVESIMRPVLTDKNFEKIKHLFQVIVDDDFLPSVYLNVALRSRLSLLNDYMGKWLLNS